MHDLNRFEMQHRREMPKIVESVPCPQAGCGAIQGQKCRNVSAGFGTLAQQAPRRDYHQARKVYAIDVYLANAGVGSNVVPIKTETFSAQPAPWEK